MPALLFRLFVHGSTVRIGRVQGEPVTASITMPLVEPLVTVLLAAVLSVMADLLAVTLRRSLNPFLPGSKLKPIGVVANSEFVTVVVRVLLPCSGSAANTASARRLCWPAALRLILLNTT